jgi:predicted DNA-binding protein (MmcQ/YjbR family)
MSTRFDEAALERLRAICSCLPGTVEVTTFGHPTFQAGPKKTFAVLDDHERKGELRVVVKVAHDAVGELLRDPRVLPSKFGAKHGWTSLLVDGRTDWRLVARLVTDSYRLLAPRRMLAALEKGTA